MINLIVSHFGHILPMLSTVLLFDRPTMKTRGQSTPTYTQEETAARNACTAEISAVIQKHIDSIGAFETPNNARDGMLLALSLSIPSLEYTSSTGAKAKTRGFVINVNAPLDMESAEGEDGDENEAQPIALTRDELLAAVQAAKAAKKTAR